MWQNMIYAYRRVAKVYPMMIVFTILSIVLSVLLPLINNVLPALVVAMIEQGSVQRFLLMLAILGIVTTGGKWMLNYSNRETELYLTSFRFQTMILEFYDKVMRTGYHNVEPHQKQIDFQNAFSALNGNNWGIEQIFRKAPLFFFHLIGLIMYAGILSTIDWKILLVLFAMTVSCLIFERISYRYQQKTRKEEGEYHHATYYLGDYCSALENAKDIRLYGIENWFPQRFEQLNQKIKKLSANIWGRMKLMDVSNNLFLVVRDLLAYGILIGQVLDHTLSVAEFTFYVGMIAGFTTWLTGLVENYGYLRKASLQLGYLRNYMEMEDGKREKSGTGAPLSYPLSIEFKDVSYTADDEDIVKDISFSVKKGQTVGILGSTGAGKSTIMNLLCRFVDATSGEVLVDGVNVKDWNLYDLRDNIGMAMQDIFLFSDTIEGNIAYGRPNCTFEEIHEAAVMADANHFIKAMPEGYDTIVGERGVGLSGGQKQRISLARALLKKPSILILDDTTSAVDMETESYIQQQLGKLNGQCTIFVIAYRISSIKDADQILVMDNGRIIEHGMHQELLANDGYYASAFHHQYGELPSREEQEEYRQVTANERK